MNVFNIPHGGALSRRFLGASITVAAILLTTVSGASRKFYDDDPITREPETRDASGVRGREINLIYDLAPNMFGHPGDDASNVRARNINTIDEVPDSSWFTNRILGRPISLEEAGRGPLEGPGPTPP